MQGSQTRSPREGLMRPVNVRKNENFCLMKIFYLIFQNLIGNSKLFFQFSMCPQDLFLESHAAPSQFELETPVVEQPFYVVCAYLMLIWEVPGFYKRVHLN